MNPLPFGSLPVWAAGLDLAAHLGAGLAVGILYFRGVWWSARRFGAGGRLTTTLALALGRFAFLAGLLALAGREGALPLLVSALGVLVGRFVVMRNVRAAAS